MILILTGIVAILAVYWLLWKSTPYWDQRGVLNIKGQPFVGNFLKMGLGMSSFAEEILRMYKTNPISKVLGVYFFNEPMLMIRDPELIKSVGIKSFDHFVDRSQFFFTESDDPLMSKTVFALQGNKWRNMRTTLSPAFTGSKMRGMLNFMIECGDQCTDHYMNEYIKQGTGQPLNVNMETVFTQYANDIIATTAFGIKIDSFKDPQNIFFKHGKQTVEIKVWRMLLTSLAPAITKAFGWGIWPSSIYKFFRALMKETLATREREHIVRPDMLNLLLEAKKGNLKSDDADQSKDTEFSAVNEGDIKISDEKIVLTDEDITAQALLFFIAGFQSTAITASFAIHELAINTYIQRRLQKEIDETLRDSGNKITYDGLKNMKYLDMVFSETVRLWPPALHLDRKCTKQFTIEADDLRIDMKPGDLIMIPVFGIHRDPQYYPNPDKFDPERFSDEEKSNVSPLTYLPFGIGPRNCIGSRFAIMEAKVALVTLLSKFDIVLTEKSHVPLEIKKCTPNLASKHAHWFGLRPRETKY